MEVDFYILLDSNTQPTKHTRRYMYIKFYLLSLYKMCVCVCVCVSVCACVRTVGPVTIYWDPKQSIIMLKPEKWLWAQ